MVLPRAAQSEPPCVRAIADQPPYRQPFEAWSAPALNGFPSLAIFSPPSARLRFLFMSSLRMRPVSFCQRGVNLGSQRRPLRPRRLRLAAGSQTQETRKLHRREVLNADSSEPARGDKSSEMGILV